MATYSADELIGATLVAAQAVTGYTDTGMSAIAHQFQPGETIGKVYSYVNHTDGVWWQIDGDSGTFYVHHMQGYDVLQDGSSNLLNGHDGVLTDQEQTKHDSDRAAAAANWFTNITDMLPSGIKDFFNGLEKNVQTGVLIAAGLAGLFFVYKLLKKK